LTFCKFRWTGFRVRMEGVCTEMTNGQARIITNVRSAKFDGGRFGLAVNPGKSRLIQAGDGLGVGMGRYYRSPHELRSPPSMKMGLVGDLQGRGPVHWEAPLSFSVASQARHESVSRERTFASRIVVPTTSLWGERDGGRWAGKALSPFFNFARVFSRERTK